MISTILLVLAIVLFILKAFGIEFKPDLGWLGLACFAGSFLF